MESRNISINVVNSTGVKSIEEMWSDVVSKQSRDGKMMLFEHYRINLGGADSSWGTKVFYKTCVDLGILSKCSNLNKYCPTEKAICKFPDLFYYDNDTEQWGINSEEIDVWNENILESIVVHAKVVREQISVARKIKNKAKYHETKNQAKGLFND